MKHRLQQKIGLALGLILFVIILIIPAPEGMNPAAKRTAACTVLMAVFWITEAIPIPATAILPLILYPFFKILNAKEVALAYADRNVFLFMGGFFIAMAMQKHNLHKRIALFIIYILGTSSRKLILGFMISTAFLSMWISNTATVMMMLPIALAVLSHVKTLLEKEGIHVDNSKFSFGIALMLGIAYSASIGGVGTLVGTPPNIIFAGMVKQIFPEISDINFVQWMGIGLPVVILFLPLTWLYLVYIGAPPEVSKIPGSKSLIYDELQKLGRMSRGEIITLTVFCLTALGWIFKSDIEIGQVKIPGWAGILNLQEYIHDSTIAMGGAVLLFLTPVNIRRLEFTLNWEWAKRIPWGILILFGGGFALAASFQSSGLDRWIGNIFGRIQHVSPIILILSTCLLLTFLTEITSNTATITMMLPVLAAMAISMKIHPFIIMIPATLATSFAFMMPVATPPNAIVFGSEYLKIHHMARIGLILNFAGVIVITLAMYLIVYNLLGITIN